MKAMQALQDVVANPSGWDSLKNYAGEIPEPKWLCVLTRTRDSDDLSESNFETALERLGGESEDVQIFRFGHWACGWWEALAVARGSERAREAQELVNALDAYPVLDEEDWSRREQEHADRLWRDCYSWRERIAYMREHESQFDVGYVGFRALLAQARGEYFGGYASDLIS